MKNQPVFSIIIPTRSVNGYLGECLRALEKQTYSHNMFEVIVVINAVEMKQIPEQVYSFSLQYVHDPVLGAGHARNVGTSHASGIYVGFLDDDAKPDADWLNIANYFFTKIKPTPLVIGGRILPIFEKKKPDWFLQKYETVEFGNESRWLNRTESFPESNLIIQKKAFYEGGKFSTKTGMSGDEISSGEERKLFSSLWKIYNKSVSYYLPSLVVFHHIPEYKMSVRYKMRRSFAYGQSWYLLHQNNSGNLFVNFYYLCAFLFFTVKALLLIITYRDIRRWLYEQGSKIIFFLGYFYRSCGKHYPIRDENISMK